MSDLRPPTAQGGSFPWDPRDISLVQGPRGFTGAVPDNVVLTDGSTPITGDQEIQGTLIAEAATAQRVKASGDGAAAGLKFGVAEDTNLYRRSERTLATDGWFMGFDEGAGSVGLAVEKYSAPGGDYQRGIYFETQGSTLAWFGTDDPDQPAVRFARSPDPVGRAQINRDGKFEWGGDGATFDTNLYRRGESTLFTDHAFQANYGVTAHPGSGAQVSIGWVGPSGAAGIDFSTARDTVLYRSSAGRLRTEGEFYTGPAGQVGIRMGDFYQVSLGFTDGLGPGIMLGPVNDVNLYRQGANVLATDDAFVAAEAIFAKNAYATRVAIGDVGGAAGLTFGSANDTNLYRSAAQSLKTDVNFEVGGGDGLRVEWGLWIAKNVGAGSEKLLFGSAGDTNLYRSGANLLKTDDDFHAGGEIVAYKGFDENMLLGRAGPASQMGIKFGIAQDTNLYRLSQNQLKTDDSLSVALELDAALGTIIARPNQGGGSLIVKRHLFAPPGPSGDAEFLALAVYSGTNPNTLKLVCGAGSGAMQTILDNIPTA